MKIQCFELIKILLGGKNTKNCEKWLKLAKMTLFLPSRPQNGSKKLKIGKNFYIIIKYSFWCIHCEKIRSIADIGSEI